MACTCWSANTAITLVSEGSAIAKALDYSLKPWETLTRYLVDGHVPTDNNWLHAASCMADVMPTPGWIISVGMRYLIAGSPETVARKMKAISDAGIDGILFTWVKPLEDIRRVTKDVLPILEDYGLRRPYISRDKIDQSVLV